jgi:hypothetical protein
VLVNKRFYAPAYRTQTLASNLAKSHLFLELAQMLLQGHHMVADRRWGLRPLVTAKGKRPSRVVCWRPRHHSSNAQSRRVSRGLVYDENSLGKQGENGVLHNWQLPVNAYVSRGHVICMLEVPLTFHQPLTPSHMADLRLAASKMTGAKRCAFEAEMALRYCEGNPL